MLCRLVSSHVASFHFVSFHFVAFCFNSIQFGLPSAVAGQADGLANFVAATEETDVLHILSSATMDDASMWVKDPAPAKDRLSGARTEGSKINDKLWKRGKRVHLPVLNATELIGVRRVSVTCDGLSACEVHSASQVLPEANTSTVRDRWQQWQVLSTSSTTGSKVDPERSLVHALMAS